MKVALSRREMLFKLVRVVTSKLIRGEYRFAQTTEISAEELLEQLGSSKPPLLIDTRLSSEFSSGFGHIPGSIHLPLMELVGHFGSANKFKSAIKAIEQQLAPFQSDMDREVITICPGGGFSLVAAEIMNEAGYTDVKSLAGGVDGWFKKGYPTELTETADAVGED